MLEPGVPALGSLSNSNKCSSSSFLTFPGLSTQSYIRFQTTPTRSMSRQPAMSDSWTWPIMSMLQKTARAVRENFFCRQSRNLGERAESTERVKSLESYTLPPITTHQSFISDFGSALEREHDASSSNDPGTASGDSEFVNLPVAPTIPVNLLPRHHTPRIIFPRSEDEVHDESLSLSRMSSGAQPPKRTLPQVLTFTLIMTMASSIPTEAQSPIRRPSREVTSAVHYLSEPAEPETQIISEVFFEQSDNVIHYSDDSLNKLSSYLHFR